MKKIDLGQTITVLANAGVIVGIVFLAIEIGLNRESLEEANRLNQLAVNDLVLERNSTFRLTIAGDEQLSRIWFEGLADSELDQLEENRFRLLCEELIWMGVILGERPTESTGQPSNGGNAAIIRQSIDDSSRYRDCWNNMKGSVSYYGYDWFVQAVDSENID